MTRFLRGVLALLSLAAVTGCAVTVAPVRPAPARHPAYLHALEDLRHARAHLERPAAVTQRTAWDEAVAIREVDAAMREIHNAAIDDGRNPADHPPVDVRMDWAGRLHRSVELLRRARQDCAQEEDNPSVRGLQQRAIQHIDAAIAFVEQGIASNAPVVVVAPAPAPVVVVAPPPGPAPVVIVQGPGQHPAYLHALQDLRHARGHLQRPAAVTMRTAWDEAIAIREIDAAIREINAAAINDGKNIADHPLIDARMDWRGRLHRTVELLRKARQDCMQEEDNPSVRGLQQRAIQHIDGALAFVEQGIAQNHF
jgi:hypothetical protein